MEEQELYMQVKQMEHQMQTMQDHMQQIEEKIEDVRELKRTIDDLGETEPGKILVPIANGIFAEAKLTKKDPLLVNVGAGVLVHKTLDQTKELVGNQEIELKRLQQQANEEHTKLMQRAETLAGQIQDVQGTEE